MNGAESLLRTLVGAGSDVCFANPGTSEIHMVQALDSVVDMRPILALFEGVCTGAADGYGRITGKPATTMLHLGPGLGNGLANLHNARRAGSPIINLIGNHASHHMQYDAPLTSDIDLLARNVSSWMKSDSTSKSLAQDGADAFAATMTATPGSNGQIATLIVPAEASWGESGGPSPASDISPRVEVAYADIQAAADGIDGNTVILVDRVGTQGLIAANRIAAVTGCKVFGSTFCARIDGGPGMPVLNRLPYFPEHIIATLQGTRHLILAGAEQPVSFFAYENIPSLLVPEGCSVQRLATGDQDVDHALESLADILGAPADDYARYQSTRPDSPNGKLSASTIALIIARMLPEDSIICGDSGGGGAAFGPCQMAARHSWLNITGGAIGQGGPAAVGAAVASPDSRVFALLGDGAAMYTIQALWTQARESLDVTTVVFSNRQYGILDTEYRRLGVNEIGERAARLFDLGNPDLDFVQMANGMGVPGKVVHTTEEFAAALGESLALDGPYLIDARIS
jgi:acetolactate synthase-1/2/3 large subunit